MSVCLSVFLPACVEQVGSNWTDLHEVLLLEYFPKYVEKIQASLKSDPNNGYFT
jgi:hypothetical protein